MNRDETQRAIEVMQAWADGRAVEWRHRPEHKWRLVGDYEDWNWATYDFRIKPEPREWWVHVNTEGPGGALPIPPYMSPPPGHWVRVREVMEGK